MTRRGSYSNNNSNSNNGKNVTIATDHRQNRFRLHHDGGDDWEPKSNYSGGTADVSDSSSETSIPEESSSSPPLSIAEQGARSFMEKVSALAMQLQEDEEFMASPTISRCQNQKQPFDSHSTCSFSSDDDDSSEVISTDSDPTIGLKFSLGDLDALLPTPHQQDDYQEAPSPGATAMSSSHDYNKVDAVSKTLNLPDYAADLQMSLAKQQRQQFPLNPMPPRPPRQFLSTMAQKQQQHQPRKLQRNKSVGMLPPSPPLPSTPEETAADFVESPNTTAAAAARDLIQRSSSKSIEQAYSSSSSRSLPNDRYIASHQLISAQRTRGRKKTNKQVLRSSLMDNSKRSGSSTSTPEFLYPSSLGSEDDTSKRSNCHDGASSSASGARAAAAAVASSSLSAASANSSSYNSYSRRVVSAARSSVSLPPAPPPPPTPTRKANVGQDVNGWEHPSPQMHDDDDQQQQQRKKHVMASSTSACSLPATATAANTASSTIKFSELDVDQEEWQHPSLTIKTRKKIHASSSASSVGSLGSLFRRSSKDKDYKKSKKSSNKSKRSESQSVGSRKAKQLQAAQLLGETPDGSPQQQHQAVDSKKKRSSTRTTAKTLSSQGARATSGAGAPPGDPKPAAAAAAAASVVASRPPAPVSGLQPSRPVRSILKTTPPSPSTSHRHQPSSSSSSTKTSSMAIATAEYVDYTKELEEALRACQKQASSSSTWLHKLGLRREKKL